MDAITTEKLFWAVAGLLVIFMIIMTSHVRFFKNNKTPFLVISGILGVISIMRLSGLDSQLAQGLMVIGTLSLAFVAYWTIVRNEERTTKLIQANRTDQQNIRKSELLDELTDWINQIVKETYEPTTLTNIWDSIEEFILKKIDSADIKSLLDTRNQKEREKEHMNLSALLTQEKYMLNIARYFKYEETLTRFVQAAKAYKDMLVSLTAKAREGQKPKDVHSEKVLSELLGARILLTRAEGEASLIGLSEIKINSFYITD